MKRIVLGLALSLTATFAGAETRTFLVPNSPGDYGVDHCLITHAGCGSLIANAYCQSKDFARAASFRPLTRDEVTGTAGRLVSAAPSREPATYVAIECAR